MRPSKPAFSHVFIMKIIDNRTGLIGLWLALNKKLQTNVYFMPDTLRRLNKC